MGLFKKITGIIGGALQFGFGGFWVKNDTAGVQVRNAADNAFARIRIASPSTTDANEGVPFLDLQKRVILLEFSFNGGSPPAGGANTGKYGLCHTSGGSYNAGEVYYDNGSTIALVTVYKMQAVVSTTAITGTVSMIANGFYVAQLGTAPYTWTLKGDWTGAAGAELVIGLAINNSAGTFSSTTSVPSGAVVRRVEACIDTAYDGSATLAVAIQGGTPLAVMATTDNDPTGIGNVYCVEADNVVGALNAGVVRVTLGGSPSLGAARVYVTYVIPLG